VTRTNRVFLFQARQFSLIALSGWLAIFASRRFGVVLATRRANIVKIFASFAVLAMIFYYLAHYGLACPEDV
jgi:hypothetical protein